MRIKRSYHIDSLEIFLEGLIEWLKDKSPVACYNSNGFIDKYGAYNLIVGVGAISEISVSCKDQWKDLKKFLDSKDNWFFGFLSYETKDFIENLSSCNEDGIKMPVIHFFIPQIVFLFKDNLLEVEFNPLYYAENKVETILSEIKNKKKNSNCSINAHVKPRLSRDEYLEKIKEIQKHINYGDIYEMNFCMEFFAEAFENIYPENLYKALNEKSPNPFSCFYKINEKALICSSPERFLRKINSKIISQPIKGTAPRSPEKKIDREFAKELLKSEKEKSENVMIVDLVRNDLSKIAQKGSVCVDELFGIYSFPFVHQMISTVSAELKHGIDFTDVIKASFPPGSMTGAPKIRAMEIIEKYETRRRGLYSGTVGYISPNKDFDFNVVIRSILMDTQAKYLSFHVGGAITALSDPEKEYEECLLKAEAMLKVLKQQE
ncbi:MAG: aminodeoxychorismate synthase component I [Bacteroidales bacterium]|nr:aminodeoxychorismate synthase component I [Bacteroidales bacterium]